jgi:glutamine synthetase
MNAPLREPDPTTAEAEAFLATHPGVAWIDLIMFDMSGIARGKRIKPGDLIGVARDGILIPSTIYIIDTRGNCVEETGRLWETGDPDLHFRILAGTLAPTGAKPHTHAQAVIVPVEDTGGLDPRMILAGQQSLLAREGLRAVTAVELEFYVTKRAANGDFKFDAPKGVASDPDFSRLYQYDEIDELGGFIDDVYAIAAAQGLPVGSIIQESGPGQFEINLTHKADVVAAALDGLLLKRAVKSAARGHGLDATFMAKPHHDWSGSGMHIHMSLIDASGGNVFAGDPISSRFRHAIGGLQATMCDFMAVWAQSANAYRRYVPKSYVAMQAHWGFNNRNVALRIPRSTHPAQTRIEHRVSGADANPYLVAAAIVAGMRHGMAERTEPGEMAEGSAESCRSPELPTAWVNALAAFNASKVAKEAFGESFHDAYFKLKSTERIAFERTVTDLDYAWYAHVA